MMYTTSVYLDTYVVGKKHIVDLRGKEGHQKGVRGMYTIGLNTYVVGKHIVDLGRKERGFRGQAGTLGFMCRLWYIWA
jgi:hypothetical protein